MKAFLTAVKNLWASGRQSRFLADISPKFIASAMLTTKNPVFLESVRVAGDGTIDNQMIKETLQDYKDEIVKSVVGVRTGAFNGEVTGGCDDR